MLKNCLLGQLRSDMLSYAACRSMSAPSNFVRFHLDVPETDAAMGRVLVVHSYACSGS